MIKEQLSEKDIALPAVSSKIEAVVYNPKQCPCCKKETMETIMRFNGRGPPVDWKEMATNLLACIATSDVTTK